jgi:hypothetical protein
MAEHNHHPAHNRADLFVGAEHDCCIVSPDAQVHIAVGISAEDRVSAIPRHRREVFTSSSGSILLEIQNNGFVTSPLAIDIESDNPDFSFDVDSTPLTGQPLERRELVFRSSGPGWASLRLRFRTTSLVGDLADRDLVDMMIVCEQRKLLPVIRSN